MRDDTLYMKHRKISEHDNEDSLDAELNQTKGVPPVMKMKKHNSATTDLIVNTKVNNLKSMKTMKTNVFLENKELSAASDYRSTLSQLPHNDFEFLQNLTAEKKLRLLIKAHERKSERKKGEEEISNNNPENRIPNIFDNKDPILNDSKQASEDNLAETSEF